MRIRQKFPIRKFLVRLYEVGLFTSTANKVSNMLGRCITKRFKVKLQASLERLDQAHRNLRAYFKNFSSKQYEKNRIFFRMEIFTSDIPDIRISKSLVNLSSVPQWPTRILARFATFQAIALNTHLDFQLFQRLILALTQCNPRIVYIKIYETRMMCLMETIMQVCPCLSEWNSASLHEYTVAAYQLLEYTNNQIRNDLHKMKTYELLGRDVKQYSHRLTEKEAKIAVMFVLFYKRVCGPLANSLFHHCLNRFYHHRWLT